MLQVVVHALNKRAVQLQGTGACLTLILSRLHTPLQPLGFALHPAFTHGEVLPSFLQSLPSKRRSHGLEKSPATQVKILIFEPNGRDVPMLLPQQYCKAESPRAQQHMHHLYWKLTHPEHTMHQNIGAGTNG